ncbi:MAG: peptidase T [Desulfitobacteriaceae bacterium]
MLTVSERFLRYVQFDTRSDEESNSVPSTPGQILLAEALTTELKEIGLSDVSLDEHGYVYATLPSNRAQKVPTIGFIAHMDTSPDASGIGVKPQIIKNYAGGDILLHTEKNIILSPSDFPDLLHYSGQDLITTDGTTLLGADDKAGIAEIITAIEYLISHPEVLHGEIRIAFTPDEEIGRGTDYFDLEKFGADFAFTMDGGPLGELEFENFNAAKAKVTIQGRNVHPGTAKDKMFNSLLLANEYLASLPANETPAHTEGYEGFYHLTSIQGEVEETVLSYIIRDFDKAQFDERKETLHKTAQYLQGKYPQAAFRVEIKDQYYNMKEKIEPVKHIVDMAYQAMEEIGITPMISPIRGGTDGARLSYEGLPTPNIFSGGHNFHGRFEYIPLQSMEKAVETILKIAELCSRT